MSEEQKNKMTEFMRNNNPRRGKHHTEEAKRKISKANKGRVVGKEGRVNMRKAQLGSKSPWRWRKIAVAVSGNKYSLANCCCGNKSTYKGYIWTRNKINNNTEKEVICA